MLPCNPGQSLAPVPDLLHHGSISSYGQPDRLSCPFILAIQIRSSTFILAIQIRSSTFGDESNQLVQENWLKHYSPLEHHSDRPTVFGSRICSPDMFDGNTGKCGYRCESRCGYRSRAEAGADVGSDLGSIVCADVEAKEGAAGNTGSYSPLNAVRLMWKSLG